MLDQASTSILVVGKECLSEVMPLLNRDQKLTLIFPDVSKSSLAELESTFLQHLFVSSDDLEANKMIPTTCTAGPDDLAYLMFTSGSTGAPKGVPISHQNATSYVSYMMRRYRVAATDRFSQAVDQTFDLSVHDMFVCWLSGACLCPVPKEAVMAPSRFIREKNITMWLSVPSTGVFMLRMRMLRPGAFPSLRFSLFCGEPLTAAVAQAWAAASPNGVVENIYGPTEATVAITHYRWNAERSADECVNGIVPIGWMFEGQKGLLIREDGRPATTGCDGELLLAGSQVTAGYWGAAAKNNTRFITVAGDDEKHWYRTGDLVRRGENDCLYYLSRLDDQIKIRGYRVELQEIDFVLRRATGNEASVSVAWPVRAGVADGVVAFVAAEGGDIAGIRRACQDALPDYMVPSEILFIDELPLNPSGKVDRSALRKRLEEHADGAD
jgi:amino acid adenylation domain-containing protein